MASGRGTPVGVRLATVIVYITVALRPCSAVFVGLFETTVGTRPTETKRTAPSVLTAAGKTGARVVGDKPVDEPLRLARLTYAGAASSEPSTVKVAQTELSAGGAIARLTAYRLAATVAPLRAAFAAKPAVVREPARSSP